jgi:hypothetical protein
MAQGDGKQLQQHLALVNSGNGREASNHHLLINLYTLPWQNWKQSHVGDPSSGISFFSGLDYEAVSVAEYIPSNGRTAD